jgi:hypothetical protein
LQLLAFLDLHPIRNSANNSEKNSGGTARYQRLICNYQHGYLR